MPISLKLLGGRLAPKLVYFELKREILSLSDMALWAAGQQVEWLCALVAAVCVGDVCTVGMFGENLMLSQPVPSLVRFNSVELLAYHWLFIVNLLHM